MVQAYAILVASFLTPTLPMVLPKLGNTVQARPYCRAGQHDLGGLSHSPKQISPRWQIFLLVYLHESSLHTAGYFTKVLCRHWMTAICAAIPALKLLLPRFDSKLQNSLKH